VQGIKAYEKSSNQAATNEQLVLRVFEKAIVLMWEARDCLDQGDKLSAVEPLHTTRLLFTELNSSLDTEGGELSVQLRQLYMFILKELSTAGFEGSIPALENAISVAEELYEGFFEAFTQDTPQ
jgi:flagellar biosynthetic protein FliS